jgi:hypothetical protein
VFFLEEYLVLRSSSSVLIFLRLSNVFFGLIALAVGRLNVVVLRAYGSCVIFFFPSMYSIGALPSFQLVQFAYPKLYLPQYVLVRLQTSLNRSQSLFCPLLPLQLHDKSS